MQNELQTLAARLDEAMAADRHALGQRLAGLRRRVEAGKPIDRGLAQVRRTLEASIARRQARSAALPVPEYPAELPVSARREAIAEAIRDHQVVVVAGETGSGKTTQLPKICLELGRGAAGLIGHTQPRRIAARTVAARIAGELRGEVGRAVGYKVRFSDRVGPDSFIKLMTDGILLAETQGDPWLAQYDTLIIDEAHERSLNIDFLLGYLRELLPRRPDLKLIITSATIDTERFARHFDAPVVEVSGRTYPVEVHYRPLAAQDEEARDRDLQQAVAEAVDELTAIDPRGDILVFLPGEREIRETAETLRKRQLHHAEVLPLYSRLSVAEQNRIFQPHARRRIVLATNVAETSLTVPGIRFVIDPGLARISRYSHRTKVQRLPIEPVSQASANQRAGRCGRVSEGVCIRLYAEEDFLARPEFTEPEILRTNLASVILQMKALGLGEVERFPFVDPPERRYINDGYRLLHELGAVDAKRALTDLGRQLARLPVDPRIGRMVLAARAEGCLTEALVITAALSIQDPRERPLEAQAQADEAHRRLADERSDFLGFLNLWEHYHAQARHLSQNKLRRWCREHFLSYVRLREWRDIHSQLTAVVKEMGAQLNQQPADYGAIHRALLAGLLSQIALKDEPAKPGKARPRERGRYTGARNIKLHIFPGSALFKKPPKWVMAAELVETSRLYARTVAAIQPQWLERLGAHLVKRSHSEPHWERKPAQVAAFEQVSLYGLIIVGRRRVNYGPIDPVLSRELFIRHALVEGDYRTDAPFFRHNRDLLAEVEALEAKSRRRDVLVDEQTLYAFYDARVPPGIYSGAAFEAWRREAEATDPQLLFLTREALMRHTAEGVTVERFPDQLAFDGVPLRLAYHFEPGHPADGVTALVPLAALNALRPGAFEWLVPGLLEEKVTALIRALPKALRKSFVPAPNFAAACIDAIAPEQGELLSALRAQLRRMTGVAVPESAWAEAELPAHLHMNFRVLDPDGGVVGEGRELTRLQAALGERARASLREGRGGGIERTGITRWDFGSLPESVAIEGGAPGLNLQGYPALVDEGESVALRVFDRPESARRATGEGVCRLFALTHAKEVRYIRKNLPGIERMCLHYAPVGRCEELCESLVWAAIRRAFLGAGEGELPRDASAFASQADAARRRLVEEANGVANEVGGALAQYHALRKRLGGSLPPTLLHTVADVRGQLDHLVYPGFVTATPPEWLAHLPRYLEAIALRLEKAPRDPERDRRHSLEVAALWNAYQGRAQAQDGAPGLERFRWLVEELRVSLFAQELGTVEPVSVKRLQRLWKDGP